MNRLFILPLLITSGAVLLVLNLALIPWSHRLPYYRKLETIRTSHQPNLLFVGNSLLDHHLDEPAFEESAASSGVHWTVLNSALGASKPPEQQLLFQYAVQKHAGISTLVIGFYDFMLTEQDRSHVADLTGNRMIGMDHRFPFSEVVDTYGFGARDKAELELVRLLPMAAYRANAWKYVELLRRRMASVEMPKEETNSMGRVEDFTALESDSTRQFDMDAQTFLASPDHFNSSFEAIFARAQASKMRIVLVVMPMSPDHLGRFYTRPLWSEYLAAVTKLASAHGIQVIDASRWMPAETDFADHLHLTFEAARPFSARLGKALAQMQTAQSSAYITQ